MRRLEAFAVLVGLYLGALYSSVACLLLIAGDHTGFILIGLEAVGVLGAIYFIYKGEKNERLGDKESA